MRWAAAYVDSFGNIPTPQIDQTLHPFTEFDACYVLGLEFALVDAYYKAGALERTALTFETLELGFRFHSYYDLIECSSVIRLTALGIGMMDARDIIESYLDCISSSFEKGNGETIRLSSILEAALIALGIGSNEVNNNSISPFQENMIVELITAFLDTNRSICELLQKQNDTIDRRIKARVKTH